MIKIGLTGGICSGKSHVLSIFQQLGAYTIKADQIAKDVLFGDDPQLLNQIIEKLDLSSSVASGQDKQLLLSKLLFENPEKRLLINKMVHPKVMALRNKMIVEVEKSKLFKILFYESALLVESGSFKDFDKILVVYCNPTIQQQRLMLRDKIDITEAEKRIRAQFPLTEKLKRAHYTIDTSGTLEQTTIMALETYSLMQRDFNL
jgi:dephospho-CoA kinase